MQKRLPWGVYLALWGCGTLLVTSVFPIWRVFPRQEEWFGKAKASFWQALSDIFSGQAAITEGFWPHNIRLTLIFLAFGAALGAGVRWKRGQMKRNGMK